MDARPQESPQGQELPPRGDSQLRGMRLGRILGVEVRLDWSLAIIFMLILVNLGAGVFPRWHPDWSFMLNWGIALGAAVLFFGSILVHELSHALVARTQGISVPRITLFLFGGMAHMEDEPPSPKAELAMAIVGPVVSLGIGILATLVGVWIAERGLTAADLEDPVTALQAIGPIATLLLWLGPINILIGLFNFVPGFPLDGGRVLRAILWGITGDLTKATRWASSAGQFFAWALMAIGVFNLFAGALAQGIWLLLIGWFLNNAARYSYQQLLVRKALEGVPVSRVMQTRIASVSPDLSIEDLVRYQVMRTDQHAFPVEDEGHMVGLVCLDDVRKVPHDRWPSTSVSQVMTPIDQLSTLPEDAPADRALEELARRDVDQIPVVKGDHVLGLVRRSDLVKWLALQGPSPARI